MQVKVSQLKNITSIFKNSKPILSAPLDFLTGTENLDFSTSQLDIMFFHQDTFIVMVIFNIHNCGNWLESFVLFLAEFKWKYLNKEKTLDMFYQDTHSVIQLMAEGF